MKVRRKQKLSPPWWNNDLQKMIKHKYQMYKQYRHHQTKESFMHYAKARNETLAALRKARQKFENDLAKMAKKNPKKLAKYIRSQGKVKDRVCQLLKQDGTMADSGHEIAQELQRFFCSGFVYEKDGELPEFADRVEEADVLENIEVTVEIVRSELQGLNEEKAPGPDGISPFLLKKCTEQVIYPLVLLFRKSLQEGQLPEQWKKASVVPIFKAGSKKSPSNYRPVSLTSRVCKILERIIKKQVTQHLQDKELISPEQHGFVAKKSCLTNLLETLEDCTQILDNNKTSLDIIYCDFRKAFDSVPHRRLIKKLSAMV